MMRRNISRVVPRAPACQLARFAPVRFFYRIDAAPFPLATM